MVPIGELRFGGSITLVSQEALGGLGWALFGAHMPLQPMRVFLLPGTQCLGLAAGGQAPGDKRVCADGTHTAT